MPETIQECSRLIRTRELTVSDLVEAVIGRLDETEPAVHAYVHVDHDGARALAERADHAIQNGRYRGSLHGIPVGVKDVFCTADMPTRAGSSAWSWPGVTEDAVAVRLLREAGAIVMGKHQTHEFACGQNEPPTRNAWNTACYPGGSSAGAGTSVAVGSSLGAIGTDAGGSVRKPAALNGVVGLKPTFGRISRRGIAQPSGSMDHVGLVTRSTGDAGLVLQALCRRDAGDPTLVDQEVPDFSGRLGMSLRGVRIGVCGYFFGNATSAPVAELANAALDTLRQAGAILCAVDIPELDMATVAGGVIIQAEAGISHRRHLVETPEIYGVATRRYLETGVLTPAEHLRAASVTRAAIARSVRDVFQSQRLDALVSPTTPLTAMLLRDMNVERDLPRYIRYTVVANLTGLPAVTVPAGFHEGLPVGLQLMGRPFQEPELLGIANACESLTSLTIGGGRIAVPHPQPAEALGAVLPDGS